ncbi:hypothetical protein [Leptospira haakeii]|uniref:Lipoprotein n=1 Tax=Leptospira haakeii TaxID=2023198 RepID=A0ABX4PS83_9LEPT|nr:hypothetical protein [Leptospira haakeii]PKA17572.1 hypothetical protein CH363_02690 [Leptospira haakeii]PKA21297.1 hypothetical protein CH377_02690 [Leptospira haakeii]
MGLSFRHFFYALLFVLSFIVSSNCEGDLYEVLDPSLGMVKDAAYYVESHKLEDTRNLRIFAEPSDQNVYVHFNLKVSPELFLKEGWKKGNSVDESFWKEELVWDILHFGLEAPIELGDAQVYIREDLSGNFSGNLEVLVLTGNGSEGYLVCRQFTSDSKSYLSNFSF